MKVSAVIAVYDERENIEVLTRRLARILDGLPDCTWEIVYVVEGTDGTREVLEGLAGEIAGIRVIYERTPRGLGNAFRRGFSAVAKDADIVVTMDADLNHKPEELPRLLSAFESGRCDILIGSRFVSGGLVERVPVWKAVVTRSLNPIMRLVFGLGIRDLTSGYRLYRRDALRTLTFSSNNFAFLPELLIVASGKGLRIAEAPIHFVYRIHGRSKMALVRTSRSYLGLFLRRLYLRRQGGS